MARMNIKKGDLVQVLTGRDKGLQGKVISVDISAQRVLVEGVNRVTKHVKAQSAARGGGGGGLVVTEAPVHVSNVALVDPEDNKPTRVGYRTETVERDGRTRSVRVRVSKRSGKDI